MEAPIFEGEIFVRSVGVTLRDVRNVSLADAAVARKITGSQFRKTLDLSSRPDERICNTYDYALALNARIAEEPNPTKEWLRTLKPLSRDSDTQSCLPVLTLHATRSRLIIGSFTLYNITRTSAMPMPGVAGSKAHTYRETNSEIMRWMLANNTPFGITEFLLPRRPQHQWLLSQREKDNIDIGDTMSELPDGQAVAGLDDHAITHVDGVPVSIRRL